MRESTVEPQVPDQQLVLHGIAIRANADPELLYTELDRQLQRMRECKKS